MLKSPAGGQVLRAHVACVFVACFLCVSCSKPQTWVYSEVHSSAGFMTPARIQALTSADYVQIEIARSDDANAPLQGHINFLYQRLQPAQGEHPDLIELTIQGKSFLCSRLKGGGRLLLSGPATLFLIEELKTKGAIEISIEGKSLSVEADGFAEQLERLEKGKINAWVPSFGLDWS